MILALTAALQTKGLDPNNRIAFTQPLFDARSRLPTVPVATDAGDTSWTKVRLNSLGARFDAIQIKPPLPKAGGMVWALASDKEIKCRWGITDMEGNYMPFSDPILKSDVVLNGVELSDRNHLLLQQCPAFIFPNVTYIIWFEFDDTTPVDLYVKIKLIYQREMPSGPDGQYFAGTLQLLPLRRSAAASFDERLTGLLEQKLFADAKVAIEQQMSQSKVSPYVQLQYVRITYELAVPLAQDGQQAAARELFVKAAKMLREMNPKALSDSLLIENFVATYRRKLIQKQLISRGSYNLLDRGTQSDLPSRVYYNEACALAMSGQTDAARQSLRDAVKAGFSEWSFLMQDEELRSLQDSDDYIQFVDELQASMKGKTPSFRYPPPRKPDGE